MSRRPSPPDVVLSLVGGFELTVHGVTVDLAPASRRLLAYVALQHRPAARGRISEALWADVDPRHAAASLRSCLWRLAPLRIVTSSATHIHLDPRVEVDVDQLALLASSPPVAPRATEDLVALSLRLVRAGDDLLPGWDDDWVVLERERCRQACLRAMDLVGDELVDSGRSDDALRIALAATAAEPLRESAHRVLVRAHLSQGNVAEAVREYLRFAELLEDELGARPSATMRELLSPLVRPAVLAHASC
ncbi:MAG: BTAD domain-containing putative transcriptional regulator [Propionicimonas sp.]|uniref:AfsR/SARP family transcriptional regulator n=1 Tax=Propionicimonas sp. TaxID=1955623 RepID=UPI003D153330